MTQMAEFVKIPTDNLYKFIAISGLIMLILSITIPFFFVRDLSIQVAQAGGEKSKLQLELQYIGEDITKAENDIADLTQEKVQDLTNRLRQYSMKQADFDASVKTLQVYDDEITEVEVFMWGAFAVGWIFVLYGFFSWYFKWQRYQDIIIRNEAQKYQK